MKKYLVLLMNLIGLYCIDIALAIDKDVSLHTHFYVNNRFGYSISYPENFIPQPEADNGDGRVFLSHDGLIEIRVWGSYHPSFEEAYQELLDEKQVTYRVKKNQWFVVSGIEDKNIFYQKTFSGRHALYSVRFTYPKRMNSTFSPLLETIVRTFSPGKE